MIKYSCQVGVKLGCDSWEGKLWFRKKEKNMRNMDVFKGKQSFSLQIEKKGYCFYELVINRPKES